RARTNGHTSGDSATRRSDSALKGFQEMSGHKNYEMASVNAVVRTVIQMLYGTALMAGSYREAALCYEAAVRIRPDYLIHRVELGRTYAKMGQREAARAQLEAAVELDVPDINAFLQKADAVGMLAKMQGPPR
ncbi:hypothetical protein TSOC_004526, partial [Tetrabaena socialis]